MLMKAELGIQQITSEKAGVEVIEKGKHGNDEYFVRYKGDRSYGQPRYFTKGELDNRYTDWESKVVEHGSVFRFNKSFSSFFRFLKSQMDMFGAPKPQQTSGQLHGSHLDKRNQIININAEREARAENGFIITKMKKDRNSKPMQKENRFRNIMTGRRATQ